MSSVTLFNPYLAKSRKCHVEIEIIDHKLGSIKEKSIKDAMKDRGFEAKSGQIFPVYDKDQDIKKIYAGISDASSYEDAGKIFNAAKGLFAESALKKTSFSIASKTLKKAALERLHIGWGLASYNFDRYKQNKNGEKPKLVIAKDQNTKRIQTYVEAVCLVRDLVNTPANDLGPEELEKAIKSFAKNHDLTVKTIKDKPLLEKKFPMIYAVGKGSARGPRLLEFTWGDTKNLKLTLVGKGVCFDTGGLDIKPSSAMLTMKKDMGGAAHVIGLSHLIMNLKLPVRLHVLIPAVENSISGDAYRPSDILQTRKGITVEVGNTDAEGRLILADTLTYACEKKPKMLIDFATLTGAARIALGFDLPGLFSNNEKTARKIQDLSASEDVQDPVWNLPLWKPYRKELDSHVADIRSSTGGSAGATAAALFLQEFMDKSVEWVHLDVYAWEQNGKPSRPKGGADTGMRAMYAFLEERFKK
ncbi:MAG: leucyl aminopeptidase family protein [Alphaproteobacteria bacterium]|nr:leucyl aminopeptidase family protein [Alphaproteobacteria bacterium]